VSDPDPRLALAYESAVAELRRQAESLDELRSRVGTVLSAGSIATGFLAGTALDRHKGIPWPAWVGIVSTALLLFTSLVILWPRTFEGFRTRSDWILENVKNQPDQSLDAFFSEMTGFAASAADKNHTRIAQLYTAFSADLILLGLGLGGWIYAIAIK
jgi:hypothetical protein